MSGGQLYAGACDNNIVIYILMVCYEYIIVMNFHKVAILSCENRSSYIYMSCTQTVIQECHKISVVLGIISDSLKKMSSKNEKMSKVIVNTQFCLLFICKLSLVLSQEVLIHPYSRVVPVGTEVYFTCKLRGAQNPHWMIGHIEANTNFHKNYLSTRGIYILDNEQNNGIITLALVANSSYSNVNNTQITCRGTGIRSRVAHLLIINRKC